MSKLTDQLNQAAKLEDIISDFASISVKGDNVAFDCPHCHAKNQMSISKKKQLFKCFKCGSGGKTPLNLVMIAGNKTLPEAISYLKEKYHIDDEDPAQRKQRLAYDAKIKASRKKGKTFLEIQMESSGLTHDDIRATVQDGDKVRQMSPFRIGSIDQYWKINPGTGDDMLIYYYDLEGNPILYNKEGSKISQEFCRVRFQNPNNYTDKSGKPIKYYSPKGSGTNVYIPEAIRKLYKQNRPIKRLFFQEGEKKSEKACKHGIPSIGIMGIQQVGSHNIMPRDIQVLITSCQVKEVVFVLDSDWQDLHSDIKVGDNVHKRPMAFFYAIKAFKEYMLSLRNIGINLEIYFAAGKSKQDKGIDDLLNNTLKANPEELQKDIDFAINSKPGEGQFMVVKKITTLTDQNIRDFFFLNDSREFANLHIDVLKHVPEFTINKTKFRINDNNELELAEPLTPDEKFWSEDGKGRLSFNYENCYNFLQNRGFFRLKTLGQQKFVRFQNNIVDVVERIDIKDFVKNVAREVATQEVRNMLYAGGHFYLGPHSLENLDFIYPNFEVVNKSFQRLHFSETFWTVTADKITEHSPLERKEAVWQMKIKDIKINLLEPVIKFDYDTKTCSFICSPEGQKCHFLQFLINTCNFNHTRSKTFDGHDIDEQYNMSVHLLSKLTALGFLTHRYFNAGVSKAVICMDSKNCEVGASNGRTGKSLFGKAIEHIVPTAYIGGKAQRLTEDPFLFEEVSEETEVVFFDDVRANIDFEFFFPNITGKWLVNRKGLSRVTLPQQKSPKLLFSTNHAIRGEGGSFRDRQHILAFSDFYNDDHKPTDDFPLLFFDEWDNLQWNLFYNLVAKSLQLYFQYGLVAAPVDDIRKRQLRQNMGEDFLTWAEEFFAPGFDPNDPSTNLNKDLARHDDLWIPFIQKNPRSMKYMTPTGFGKCVRWFCEYKGYHFNPNKLNKQNQNIDDFLKYSRGNEVFIGESNKSGGVEYFHITDKNKLDDLIPF